MKVEKFFNPISEENMYVVVRDDNTCLIVDPGDIYMTKVINYIKENNLDLVAILLTHAHFDHILGLEKVLKYKNVPIYIHELEKEWLYDPKLSLAYLIDNDFSLSKEANVITFTDKDNIFNFKVMHTPGHSIGSSCFYDENNKILISGDTIMKQSHGRIDFPTGDLQSLINSLREIIELPPDTNIYPGHGANTILANEKRLYKYY